VRISQVEEVKRQLLKQQKQIEQVRIARAAGQIIEKLHAYNLQDIRQK
jgi:hypothetical protein